MFSIFQEYLYSFLSPTEKSLFDLLNIPAEQAFLGISYSKGHASVPFRIAFYLLLNLYEHLLFR